MESKATEKHAVSINLVAVTYQLMIFMTLLILPFLLHVTNLAYEEVR